MQRSSLLLSFVRQLLRWRDIELLWYWVRAASMFISMLQKCHKFIEGLVGFVWPFPDFCSRKDLEVFLKYMYVGSPFLQPFLFHLFLSNLFFAHPFLCNWVVETIATEAYHLMYFFKVILKKMLINIKYLSNFYFYQISEILMLFSFGWSRITEQENELGEKSLWECENVYRGLCIGLVFFIQVLLMEFFPVLSKHPGKAAVLWFVFRIGY